jgi:hypothetical protein
MSAHRAEAGFNPLDGRKNITISFAESRFRRISLMAQARKLRQDSG